MNTNDNEYTTNVNKIDITILRLIFLTSDTTFRSSIRIKVLNVIVTILVNESKNNVTAMNIITHAYIVRLRELWGDLLGRST
jgi:hypothetical protein